MAEIRINDKGHSQSFQNKPHYRSNIEQKRYFSGIDAEIYFGDSQFIDDIVDINFEIQQNSIPLFGYNSFVYDEVALGARIIQGSFSINFTKSNYLFEVIDALKKESITAGDKSIMTQNNGSIENENIMVIDPIWEQRKNTLWNHQFNIMIAYGDFEDVTNGMKNTLIVLNGVQLTKCSQQFNYEGEPIIERYEFFGKDIQFLPGEVDKYIEMDNSEYEKQDKELNSRQKSKDDFIINKATYKINNSIELTEKENKALDMIIEKGLPIPDNLKSKKTGTSTIEYSSNLDIVNIEITPKNTPSYKITESVKVGSPFSFPMRMKQTEELNGNDYEISIKVSYKENEIIISKDYSVSIKSV